jgi:hypothetical protein
MAENVLSHSIKYTYSVIYFSVSVDSTPDITHVDQLTFIIRYAKENGQPVELSVFSP